MPTIESAIKALRSLSNNVPKKEKDTIYEIEKIIDILNKRYDFDIVTNNNKRY